MGTGLLAAVLHANQFLLGCQHSEFTVPSTGNFAIVPPENTDTYGIASAHRYRLLDIRLTTAMKLSSPPIAINSPSKENARCRIAPLFILSHCNRQVTYVQTSNVRWHIQSLVSNKLNNASCPPTARNLTSIQLTRASLRDAFNHSARDSPS